jgi:leucyl-tRNA synthetase
VTQPTPSSDRTPGFRYTAALAGEIETRWQEAWEREGAFTTPNPGDPAFDASRPKFYCLDMFPYPSGAGLHVGHPEGYTATDIICRYKRMKGFNVLHPMGWDAFGLPAEQYAIQTGVHPAITTRRAIDNFRRQLKRFGFSYDWSREFATIDPDYYKWTQWVFLRLYNSWYDSTGTRGRGHAGAKGEGDGNEPGARAREGAGGRARPIAELIEGLERGVYGVDLFGDIVAIEERPSAITGAPVGTKMWHELTQHERRAVIDEQRLAYLGEQTVNWCPKLGTALANEEVIDGKSERGGFPVFRKPLKQWMFRITAYAPRLLADLDLVDWPSSTKTMQAEWIGKSEGAEIDFEVVFGSPAEVRRLSGPTSTASTPPSAPSRDQTTPHPFDAETLLVARAEGFVACDPYPPGEPSADGLIRDIRRLPHVMVPGATYFVTWSTKGWRLDDAGKREVLRALRHFDGERCDVYAACVMSTHVHWIVRPYKDVVLRDLVAGVKRFSATRVNRHESMSGPLWQEDAFDHIVRDERWLGAFLRYVARNPVEAGVCRRVGEDGFTFVSDKCRVAGGGSLAIVPDGELMSHIESLESTKAEGNGETVEVGSESRRTDSRSLRVYTTRPDTIFGATYMVIAPEHPLVDEILEGPEFFAKFADVDAIGSYVVAARNRSDVERQAETKRKTGVFSGLYAINPASGERIPIWIADYVLAGYGHGAIMAVPAHDERDFEFARAFDLPIRDVVYPRVLEAMVHFARHAPPELRSEQRWLGALADMAGYVTSSNIAPDRFDEALRVIATRRAGDDAATCPIDAEPPAGASKRGMTRLTWVETIAEMGIRSFAELADRAENAAFHARGGAPFTAAGHAANSRNDGVSLDGLSVEDAKRAIIAWLERHGLGRARTNYRLRDWLFSRQRYWGEPFPIVFDADGSHHAIDESALPVLLPDLADYQPIESDEPVPLLAKATGWVKTTAGAAGVKGLPPEAPVTRETNTMPGWAGSCWYYLRYCDPKNATRFVGERAESYWMTGDGKAEKAGVDLYVGGSEHAVLHLLYARFWHKVLFDLELVSTPEPFAKLFHQGLITAYSYQRADRSLVPNDEVVESADGASFIERATGRPVTPVVAKMSKSLKNVVNPDDVIAEYGADTFRLYEMYMGPLEASKPWNPRDITGCFRFLQRAWRMMIDEESGQLRVSAAAPDPRLERELHRLTVKVGEDIERLSFNTAIAAMMTFVNTASGAALTRPQIERFLLVLAPFCPHATQDIWSRLGNTSPLLHAAWPGVDPALLKDDEVEIPVQVGGKVRGRVTVPAGADARAIEEAALAEPRVQEWLAGKGVKKVIVVPGKLVNIVTG